MCIDGVIVSLSLTLCDGVRTVLYPVNVVEAYQVASVSVVSVSLRLTECLLLLERG
jgi:hypothetical protein